MVKIVKPSAIIVTPIDGEAILKHLEICGRTCYKSEDKITPESARKMISKLLELKHESVIEHFSVTAQLVCDVGAYKDLTRHRLASFSIESTRYCNYSKGRFGNELTVIEPVNILKGSKEYDIWLGTMQYIEQKYMEMSQIEGVRTDQLRMLLPHSTAATVTMTANMREWRHIFSLRCAPAAHPSVQQVMKMLLEKLHSDIPVLFDDIYENVFKGEN